MQTLRTSAAVIATVAFVGLALPAIAASLTVTSANLSAYRTCVLSGTTASSLSETGDANVDQGTPTTVDGTNTPLVVRAAASNNRRIYVQFDPTKCTPAIPTTATVVSATLRLYNETASAACRIYDAFRVTSSWTESTITWNNQPFGTSLNNPPTAQRSSSLNLMSSGTCQNLQGAYVSGWDVTTDVQNIVSLTNANNGWMIRDDTEGSNPARVANFTSRDAASGAQAPDLVINYL